MIVDTPAALEANEMPELTRGADKILVPVLPSDIDIHACSRCMQNLLLVAKVRRDDNRLGIIANRVRRNTLIYQSLMRFLDTLRYPDRGDAARLAELRARRRDRPGLQEMKAEPGRRGLAEWQPLLEWLESPTYHRARGRQSGQSTAQRRSGASLGRAAGLAVRSSLLVLPVDGASCRPSSCSSTRCRDCA